MSVLLGLAMGSFYGTEIDEVANDIKHIVIEDPKKTVKEEKTFQEKTDALEIEYTKNIKDNLDIKEPISTKIKKPVFYFEEPNLEEIDKKDEQHSEESSMFSNSIIEAKKTDININNKPKLAIIIDDMTMQRQINSALDLGYVVNMAFLPPTDGHPRSAKITQSLENVYMIHLPLQASSFKFEEEHTLHITDSIQVIEDRIKYIREVYPNTLYMNNHTGSKFTSNEAAMDRLFQVLKKYNYIFLDSKTTADSVVKKVAKTHGIKMFTRDIFLDNKKDKIYIQNQLKKAIKRAKRNGSAIAIGHPHSITFQTLKESKHLLEGLELVYINQL
ncbi:MAG: divergent polysaccharide deacetylase family protein [Arcobacteraceae bacterium]